ncbi:MAG: hypothetical protein NTU94_05750, partial [Planctomycetota bacterium]|nr:hypothetical protein [Planctomycetota bacterium]
DHPFQSLRLQFSQPVQDGSLTDADVTMTGPGGPLAASVSRVDASTYDVLCAGADALASYTLVLGTDILDLAGQPLDQDHNGTPGQASDVYRARLSADGLTLTPTDTAYDGYHLVLYGGPSSITGTHPLGSLELLGGAVLTHAVSTETQTAGMALSITDGLVIDAASRIDVTAKGYLYGRTHGNTLADSHGTAYWGGSYGGLGYNGYTVLWGVSISPPVETYGDFRNPAEPGAGGDGSYSDPGGSGGGLLRISAASAAIDGMILADGGQAVGVGAGSGGGVRLDVGTLSGGGWISAGGGNAVQSDADPLNGGGGGGRVALYYQTLNGFDLSHIMSVGGNMDDANAGAPGTIYIEQVGQPGQLRVDSRNLPNDMWTPLGDPADAEVTVPELVLNGQNTRVKPEHQMPVRVTDLTLTNGAVLSHLAATETAVYSLDITVSGTLTIDAASKIDASGAGYLPGRTQGNTLDEGGWGWGGGYGGLMYDYGADHDNAYGDFRDPAEPGSGERGDSGVSGGGLIRLSVATAVIDGAIVAAGGSRTSGGNSYGGSGGGIRIDAGTLRGSGIIAADGTSDCGGGRVAVYYDSLDGFSLDKVTALGGVNGTHYGSAGTVYLEQTGQDPTLLIRGRESGSAMWTPLGDASDSAVSVANVVIEGPGVVAKPQHQMPIEAESVTLGHGATLSHLASTETQTYSLDLQVSGTLTVDAESKIDVSGAGYDQNRTSGNSTVNGATEYSGASYYWGGRGGGLARISAGSAVINGAILAIGGESRGGGAGSGGGVWIDVGTLSGTGAISADGGASTWGGGGGGGRVAVYYDTLSGFDLGHLQALAGDGPWNTPGSAGTVYLNQTGQADTLVIDNLDKPAGHWTPLGAAADNEFLVDNLVIRGPNTVAKPEHQMPIRAGNVTLSNGAVLSHLAATGDEMYWLDLHVSGTLQVDAGAKIDATNLGYLPGHSMGNSTYGGAAWSGGSYGGYGYNSNAMYWGPLKSDGRTYGDCRNPTEPGSGGGRSGWNPMSGGGLVRITAATVILNGAIVADGGSTVSDSSEATGSGGGIRLDVGTLSGTGAISANGGDTRGYVGGGGRVAIYYDALDGFDLDGVSAASGISTPGWNAHWAGSPGTLYFQQTGQKGLLSIDNKGREAGFTTPLGQAFEDEFTVDNLVVNGLGVTAEPQHAMPIRVDNLTLSNGARMTHPAATETEEYSLDLRVAGLLSIDATSGINVSSKGYLAGYTNGNRNVVSTGGGSYGGRGSGDSLPTYGDPDYPNSLGSGAGPAPNNFTYPGVGGGLVTITAQSLILDGFIWADGMGSSGQNSPGGAGGGIRINVGTLSGTGEIHALGGEGYNGGGGGRIAIYTWNSRDFPPAHVRAAGGLNVDPQYGNTHQPGEAGTITYPATGFYWPGAEGRLYHDTESLRWDVLGIDPSTVTIDMTASHDGQTATVAAGASAAEAIPWDTTAGTDGQYELHAIFRASGGQVLAERTQTVTVLNAVGWHKGLIVNQQTWSADRVHVVLGDLEIAPGVAVTVEPGAIVKFSL